MLKYLQIIVGVLVMHGFSGAFGASFRVMEDVAEEKKAQGDKVAVSLVLRKKGKEDEALEIVKNNIAKLMVPQTRKEILNYADFQTGNTLLHKLAYRASDEESLSLCGRLARSDDVDALYVKHKFSVRAQLADALLELGADPNIPNNAGKTFVDLVEMVRKRSPYETIVMYWDRHLRGRRPIDDSVPA